MANTNIRFQSFHISTTTKTCEWQNIQVLQPSLSKSKSRRVEVSEQEERNIQLDTKQVISVNIVTCNANLTNDPYIT